MPYFRYIAVAMLFSLVFPAACGSSRNKVLQDPVAYSGTSSEDLWYQYGGARVAYTTVARPRQLHTGYGSVLDPALYAPTPTAAPTKRPAKARPATAPPRDPRCPPCPPAEATAGPPSTPQSIPLPAMPAAAPAPITPNAHTR